MGFRYAVYGEKGEQLYLGSNKEEAQQVATTHQGATHFQEYHRIDDKVCIDDRMFRDGKHISRNVSYISRRQLEIIAGLFNKK